MVIFNELSHPSTSVFYCFAVRLYESGATISRKQSMEEVVTVLFLHKQILQQSQGDSKLLSGFPWPVN
jgi:hypothetical protein